MPNNHNNMVANPLFTTPTGLGDQQSNTPAVVSRTRDASTSPDQILRGDVNMNPSGSNQQPGDSLPPGTRQEQRDSGFDVTSPQRSIPYPASMTDSRTSSNYMDSPTAAEAAYVSEQEKRCAGLQWASKSTEPQVVELRSDVQVFESGIKYRKHKGQIFTQHQLDILQREVDSLQIELEQLSARSGAVPEVPSDQRHSDESFTNSGSMVWRCQFCTFDNHPELPYCEQCNNKRVTTTLITNPAIDPPQTSMFTDQADTATDQMEAEYCNENNEELQWNPINLSERTQLLQLHNERTSTSHSRPPSFNCYCCEGTHDSRAGTVNNIRFRTTATICSTASDNQSLASADSNGWEFVHTQDIPPPPIRPTNHDPMPRQTSHTRRWNE